MEEYIPVHHIHEERLMALSPTLQNEIDNYFEQNDFSGVFKTRIGGWHDSKNQFNLEVYLVTASNNKPGVSCYDESIADICGHHYEVIFNGKTYQSDFASEANSMARELLKAHLETHSVKTL